MLLLLNVGNLKLRSSCVLLWHNCHTNFRKNRLSDSNVRTPLSYELTSFASEVETQANQESKRGVVLIFPTSHICTTLALPLCRLQKRCAENGTPLHAALNCGDEIQRWHVTCHQRQRQVRTASPFTLLPDYAVGKKIRLPVHASDTWKD